jgi:hypothetical protein
MMIDLSADVWVIDDFFAGTIDLETARWILLGLNPDCLNSDDD